MRMNTPRDYRIRTLEMRAAMGGKSAERATRELEELLDDEYVEAERMNEELNRFDREGW